MISQVLSIRAPEKGKKIGALFYLLGTKRITKCF